MAHSRSIRFRLLFAFFLGLLLVTVLGLFSLWRLTGYHAVAADIRDLYLPSTQYLGDLNNFTSDFRAAEAAALLAGDDAARLATSQEIEDLDSHIAQTQRNFELVSKNSGEEEVYSDFTAKWLSYRAYADRVLAEAAAGERRDATALYGDQSRLAYLAASDALGQLTERNRLAARKASVRADVAYEQAQWLILAGVILAGAILLSGLTYFRRSILQPLLKLAHSMHRLAEQDLEIEIGDAARRDEIGEMARAMLVFRRNAVDLELNRRALAEQASLLEEKLAHEKRLTELQRNFVSMASHEFRTPLTIIDGEAQRLSNTRARATPDNIAERAGTIREAVARMAGVMQNLVESARLIEERAELLVHPSEFDLAALVREVCQLHRTITPQAQIVEKPAPQPLMMVGDHKLLFQVFSNILSNAIKYSLNGGPVEACAERRGERMAVTIRDQGVGIPAQDIDRLFEQYFRGSNVSRVAGTGVGLYLVKTVVDLHGGDISVQSAEGAGATFTVALPPAPPGHRAVRT